MSGSVSIVEEVVNVSVETGAVEVVSVGVQGPPGASTSDFATVATTGSYTDLINRPVPVDVSGKADISYVDAQDAAAASSASANLAAHTSRIDNPHAVTKAQVGLANVDNTSDIAKPISSATQAALDGKQAVGDYATNASLAGGLATKADATSLAAVATSGSYLDLADKPAITKSAVGLGNVDNTSDLNKPVSTATQAALDTKAAENAVVHLASSETVTGEKTFSALQHHALGDLDLNGMTVYKPAAQRNWYAQDTVITNFQGAHGWTLQSAQGTQSNDTTNYVKGTQSLKIVTDGVGSTIFTRSATLSPTMNLTGKQVKVWVYIDQPTHLNRLRFMFSSDALATAWYNWYVTDDIGMVKPNTWVPITFSFGRGCTLNGTPNRAAINKIQVQIIDDNTGVPVTVNIGGIAYFDEPREGVVSVTFDDGWDSQYTLARTKMDEYNLRGTIYAITDNLHHDTPGYMTTAQMKQMQDESGWDISCHTHSHYTAPNDMTTKTVDVIEAEFYKSKNWLLKNGFYKGADELALPSGMYDETKVLPIASKYFRSVRTTVNYAETLPAAHPLKLRTYLVVSTTTTAQLQAAIDNAKNNKEWLILTFHKIVTTPTVSTEYSTANFNAFVDYLAASGVAVRTVSEVMNNYIYPSKDKLDYVAPGASGNVLTSNGTTWVSQASAGGGVSLGSTIPSPDSTTAATAGSASTAARSDHSHPIYNYQATDNNFKGWSYDPVYAANASIMATAGLIYAVKVPIPVATTISNLYLYVTTAGATLTAGQCVAGVYQNGALLASTADQSTSWNSTGLKTMALTGAPISVAAGYIYVAFYANGTTLPTLARAAGLSVLNNAGLTAATARFASADTGRTTSLPATLGTLSSSALSYWVAVS